MLDPTELAERLEDSANAIASADTPSDVFRALLDGFALAAPRAAAFLVRKGSLSGWSSIGYGSADGERIRQSILPSGSGWPGRLTSPSEPECSFRAIDERDDTRDLGSIERRESLGCALRVGGRTLAVLVSERQPGERPWSPAAMGILMTVARMRLEVDLARRRLRRAAATATDDLPDEEAVTAPEPEPLAAAAEPTPDGDEAAAVSDLPVEAGLAEVPSGATHEDDHDPELEAARRFARLIATDIRLYNEEDVLLGRRHGDLQRRMQDHLTRGRDSFRRRFPSIGHIGAEILRDAYVQVLAGGDEGLLGIDALAGGRSESPS